MKQQVLVIHGGTTFNSYKEYISYLKTRPVNLERMISPHDWKDNLADDLGEKYEVLKPQMPNGKNARYSEWKIWFERIIPLLNNDVILIGHSLGGIFLARYLGEKVVEKEIKATILVAAPYDDESGEPLTEFKIKGSLKKFSEQVSDIHLVLSKDDPYVPISELEKFKKALPNAKSMILSKGGHFTDEHFPQLVGLIKSL